MPPYTGPIIDPHHHLWDIGMDCHPWLRPVADGRSGLGDLDPLRRDYLVDDYRHDASRHNIVATVHIEANWRADDLLGETRWLETLDKSRHIADRVVAQVALGGPNVEPELAAQAAFPRVVGIRDILSWDPDPTQSFAPRGDIMDDPVWRAGLKCLANHDLVFDLMVFAGQLGDAARLAADFPNQLFALNHCGSPKDRDEDGMRRWRDGLRLLGRQPNVVVKISDLVAYDHDWTLDSLRPVVLHCIDCFGPDRAMFGSDFPVAGLHATFDEVYDGFKTITADFSATEQAALFFDTARRVYRIDAVSPSRRLPA